MYHIDKNQRHIVYKTGNPLIRFVGERFSVKVNDLLDSISARDKSGIDVGCGEAHLLSSLKTSGTIDRVVAFELSATNLRNAKSQYSSLNYIQGNALHMPFAEGSFDYILLTEILEHVHAPRSVLSEITRIAKTDSDVILSVPNEPFFCLGNMMMGKYITRFGKTPAHISFWNAGQFRELIEEFFTIKAQYLIATFPWQLYHCGIK